MALPGRHSRPHGRAEADVVSGECVWVWQHPGSTWKQTWRMSTHPNHHSLPPESTSLEHHPDPPLQVLLAFPPSPKHTKFVVFIVIVIQTLTLCFFEKFDVSPQSPQVPGPPVRQPC